MARQMSRALPYISHAALSNGEITEPAKTVEDIKSNIELAARKLGLPWREVYVGMCAAEDAGCVHCGEQKQGRTVTVHRHDATTVVFSQICDDCLESRGMPDQHAN
jgi:hypothetical protein